MSERGTDLMRKASGRLAEATILVGGLSPADLEKPCADEGGDSAA